MQFNKLKIESLVASDLETVWQAWTQPEHIIKWNFASDDWCCPRAVNELRVGGKYNARMEAKDGSFGFDFEAIYEELSFGKKISLKMADGRVATTEFSEMNGRTKIATVFDAEKENPQEMQKEGWQAILDNFKKYVESENKKGKKT